MNALPDAIALFEALVPLSIVDFPVLPGVHPFAMCSSVFELAEVCVSIWVPLEAFAVSEVLFPEPFVLSAIRILHDSFAMSLLVDDCAKVYGVSVPYLLVPIDFPYGW